MALLYFVAIIIHYIWHKSKHFNPHFFKTTNQSLTELNEGSVRFSTFEGTVDNWGSIGIVYPSDAHMLIGAYSSDYLLVPETHNPSVKFDSFRCFGRLQVQQLAIAPGGTKIKGWFYYI